MATYASNSDFEAYVPGWVTDNADELTKLLDRAERDVDGILGPIPRNPETGLKLDPDDLKDWEKAALANAVCAQAEYRLSIGEAALATGRSKKAEKGPDFEVQYGDMGTTATGSLIGPKVKLELEPIRHLRRLSGVLS